MGAAKLAPAIGPRAAECLRLVYRLKGPPGAFAGLVYDDKERAIALAIEEHQVLPADQNRLFARPRRMVLPGTLQIRDEAGVDEHPVEMARLGAAGACVEQTLAAREDFLLFEE